MSKRGKIGDYSRSKLQKLIEDASGGELQITEVDGSPDSSDVTKIVFPNTTVTL